MRPDLAPARFGPLRVSGPNLVRVIAIGASLALAAWVLASVPGNSSFVARLSFVNPTPYDIAVEATGATRDGWILVGIAQKQSTTALEDVIDQGHVWNFRFASQGHVAGELRMTRAQLEAANWTVRVPTSVGATLRATGAPPTP